MRKKKELTRIIVTRKARGPNTGFAGVLLVASFARLRASMAIFSAERPLSRPFDR